MSGKYINASALADGKMLVHLKKKFIEDRSRENLFPLMGCLRDSKLILPMTPQKGAKVRPDVFANSEGDLFLPLFSQNEQMPEDYKVLFTFIPLPIENCIKTAKELKSSNDRYKGIVLDPFTDGMYITFEMMDLIMEFEPKVRTTTEE